MYRATAVVVAASKPKTTASAGLHYAASSLENVKSHFTDQVLAYFYVYRLLAVLYNYKARLKEYKVVYRISKFHLDRYL